MEEEMCMTEEYSYIMSRLAVPNSKLLETCRTSATWEPAEQIREAPPEAARAGRSVRAHTDVRL